jgi:hypothetical protein
MMLRIQFAGIACGLLAVMGVPMHTAHAQWADTGIIENGGFEADEVPASPGYTSTITGWTPSGTNALINDAAGPFYVAGANGPIPEGDQVAGMQGEGTISQSLSGLVDGEDYRLDFYVNGRNCCPGPPDSPAVMSLRVSLGTQTLREIIPVELTPNFQLIQETFQYDEAWGDTLVLEFFDATGDATVLVDGFTLLVPFDADSTPFPSSPSGVPVATPLALALLAAGMAVGGAVAIRRRKQ